MYLVRKTDSVAQENKGTDQPVTSQSDHSFFYSKTCLKRPHKKDKTKVLKTNCSLMKVESIAE